jgi:mono/diheme cytochrome c family protein/cytochrome c553
MRALITATLVFFALVVRATAGFDAGSAAPVAPALLSETGLYAGEGTRQIDPRNRPFSPQYPLWSDGAAKRRWIRLPDGAAIDATSLSRWEFPVGTRFWKEFSFNGRKVETRMLWRATADRWVFAAYAWNDAQTDAALAPETGIADVAEIAPADAAQGKPAKRHTIPGIADCRSCHDSARTEILGFDALNLSDDRDANAPHAETLAQGMITLRTLTEDNLIYPKRPELISTPPRIAARSATERAALGYLSTNCGSCHNRESSIASLGLILKHRDDATLATTINQRGHWVVPDAKEESRLISPGHPESSAIIRRTKSRRPSSQMPPVGTVIVDREAVDLLTRWVREMQNAEGKMQNQ